MYGVQLALRQRTTAGQQLGYPSPEASQLALTQGN
jgi:hypothetical protein